MAKETSAIAALSQDAGGWPRELERRLWPLIAVLNSSEAVSLSLAGRVFEVYYPFLVLFISEALASSDGEIRGLSSNKLKESEGEMSQETDEQKVNELESSELELVSGGNDDPTSHDDSEDSSRRVIVGGGFGGDTIETP